MVYIQAMTGYQVEDRAFLAFEKTEAEEDSGICFLEFDKANGTAVEEPETIINEAEPVIKPEVYSNADIERIFLYTNKAGTDITITLVTRPVDGFTYVHTGKILDGSRYVPCSEPAKVQANLKGFFPFYYDNNTKNKFMQFDNGELIGEAH